MAIDSLTDIPISRRPDGRGWTFRYRAEDGTRPRITRPTLTEALAAWLELEMSYVIQPLDALEHGAASDAPTLRAFFEDVYRVKHLPDLSEDCAAQYRRYFDEHVAPVLGHEPIDVIGTKRVSDLIAAMRVKPRTRKGKPVGGQLGAETLQHFVEGLKDRLTVREREAATLCYINGFSRPEAADLLGVEPKRMEKIMDAVSKEGRGLCPRDRSRAPGVSHADR